MNQETTYRWVERSLQFTPLGPDFTNSDEAIAWGKEYVSQGILSPELAEVFLIEIIDKQADIYKPNGHPIKLGQFSW